VGSFFRLLFFSKKKLIFSKCAPVPKFVRGHRPSVAPVPAPALGRATHGNRPFGDVAAVLLCWPLCLFRQVALKHDSLSLTHLNGCQIGTQCPLLHAK
jgi:hypothetical protein